MSAKSGKNKILPGQVVSILLYIAAGAACGMLISPFRTRILFSGMPQPIQQVFALLALILLLYVCMLVQIIIHESGHLVFGLLSGYRFRSFRIFSFMWIKSGGHVRFGRMTLAGTGGQCLMEPPDLKDGRMPVILYNLGGSIMNLISAMIFWGVSRLCPADALIRMFMLFNVVIGIAYALVNGLPLRIGAVNNDGKNAVDLSRNGEAVHAFWLQMKANALTAEGVRVKDMPDEWFTLPSDEAMSNAIIATRGVLVCSRLMDRHCFAEADTLIQRLLALDSGIVALHRALLLNDRIFIELITENRQDALKALRTEEYLKIAKAMKDYPSILRTEYAAALLESGDAGRAQSILSRFDRLARNYPYSCEIDAERELIDIAAAKSSDRQSG